eukprot:scaffold33288_cov54-Phaeocystis_antarctica.AAC.1
MAEDRAVLLPGGGQAAVDDACPRPPHHAAPAAAHAVHEDPQRLLAKFGRVAGKAGRSLQAEGSAFSPVP